MILFLGAFVGGATLGGSWAWKRASKALDKFASREREAREKAKNAIEAHAEMAQQLRKARERQNDPRFGRDPNAVMANMLQTPTGRQQLAASMTQPLRTAMHQENIRRRVMPPDMLPNGPLQPSLEAMANALIGILGVDTSRQAATKAHELLETLGPHGTDDEFVWGFIKTCRELGKVEWEEEKTDDTPEEPLDPWDGPLVRR
jgi:hypothetical protein